MDQAWKEHRECLERCLSECLDLHTHTDFEPLSSPHEDIQIAAKPTGESRVLRATGLIRNASAEKLFHEVFHQSFEDKKRLGQDFLVSDQVLEKIDDLTVIRRQEFKLVWPLSNRETVTVRGGRKVGSKWVQFETSSSHPNYPVQSSPVRAIVRKACFIYEDTDDGVLATYFADVEMGGNIPAWVVSLGDAKACDRIVSFRKIAGEKSLK